MLHVTQMRLQCATSDRLIDCRLGSLLNNFHHCGYRIDRLVSNLAHHDVNELSGCDIVNEREGVRHYVCQLRPRFQELLREYFVRRKSVDANFADESG
jgi:hypothetical protein